MTLITMRTIKIIFAAQWLLIPLIAHAIPNPASIYCSQQQHHFLLIQETGICVFPDNSYCEEWSFYRNECRSGENDWPEKTVNYSGLKNYCIEKAHNKILVTLCNKDAKPHAGRK